MSKYAERLYDHFQQEKGLFNRWLLAALLLGIFYSFVFQPYLRLLSELAELEESQQQMAELIKTSDKEIEAAKQSISRALRFLGNQDDYDQLYDEAISWVGNPEEIEQKYTLQSRLVNSLRDSLDPQYQQRWVLGETPDSEIIRLLKTTQREKMQHYHSKKSCFFKLEASWLMCQINQKLAPINKKMSRVLYDRTLGHTFTDILKDRVDKNKKSFQAGKSKAMQEGSINAWVSDYLKKEKTIIQNWSDEVRQKKNELESQVRKHEKEQGEYQQKQARLDERKKSFSHTGDIDTPIGPIKLGLHDLLASVPFLGLLILIALARSIRRQLKIRSSYQMQGPKEEASPEALALTMPLWPEPIQPRITNILLLIGFAFLALFALFGLWQVITNPGLVVAEVKVNYIFIIILTISAAVYFAITYIKLVKQYLLLAK